MNGNPAQTSPSGGTGNERILYPVREVAHLLGGISERKVWNLLREGRLAHVKVGTRSFVHRDAINAYVAGLTASSDTDENAA